MIGAFAEFHVLQVIDIPRQAEVDPRAFEHCPLLEGTLEEHGTGTSTWLLPGTSIDCIKSRFDIDTLPIHQSCYKLNNDTK